MGNIEVRSFVSEEKMPEAVRDANDGIREFFEKYH